MAIHTAPERLAVRDHDESNQFFNALLADDAEQIVVDCRNVAFVDPVGLCVLRHHLASIEPLLQTVLLDNLPARLASYLERMSFFDDLPGVVCRNRPVNNRRRDLSHSLVELRKVEGNADVDPIASALAKAMVGDSRASEEQDPDGMRASPAERLYANLEYVFSEVINNAASHGRARGFQTAEIWVAAQYYRASNSVHMCISDNGCGFLNSLLTHSELQQETHEAALELALRPRISCNRDGIRALDTVNQGIGLTASHAIARRANGTVSIFSGDAFYRSDAYGAAFAPLLRPWQGVTVSLEMDRDLLQEVDIAGIIDTVAPTSTRRTYNFED